MKDIKKIRLTNKKEVFNFCKPYIIAELGSNHNGDMEIAKKLIQEAKEAGADCVKFQSWSKETIFSKKKYKDNFFLKMTIEKEKILILKKLLMLTQFQKQNF